MSISGNLDTMQLAELLQWLSQSSKSGTLIIHNSEVEKRIYFKAGRIFSSSSSDPKEHLGHFLVSYGYINEMELSKAVEMQESNRMLLGKILVTIGAISEPDLQRLLRVKTEESFYDLFTWTEGEFRFHDGELPDRQLIEMDLDVTTLVLEGARRSDEWQRIREVLPDEQVIPVVVGDLTDPGIDPGALTILQLVNDDRTVEEICLQTHSSDYRVCKILFDQVRMGRLKVVRPRRRRSPAAAAADGQVTGEALIKAAEGYLVERDYASAMRHLRAARQLEPDRHDVQKAAEKAESRIRNAIEAAGIRPEAVPKLTVDLEELTAHRLSPQEGFILTRIDGTYDVSSILKISPMQPLEGLLVFWRLAKEGHIRLEAPGSDAQG